MKKSYKASKKIVSKPESSHFLQVAKDKKYIKLIYSQSLYCK